MLRSLLQVLAFVVAAGATCVLGSALSALYTPADYENTWLLTWSARMTMGLMFSVVWGVGPAVLLAGVGLAVPRNHGLRWPGAVMFGVAATLFTGLATFGLGATLAPGIAAKLMTFVGFAAAAWVSAAVVWIGVALINQAMAPKAALA